MCRILAIRARDPIDTAPLLERFAALARNSREYQGDGWGCAWWTGERWERHRTVTPIWEDDLARFGAHRCFVAHARSAFRNEGIEEQNNMPFMTGDAAFVFNGELRGVRMTEAGRIGAEKLFNYLQRVAPRGREAWRRAVDIVEARTRYVRAMNFVYARPGSFVVSSRFNEDPEYFTMAIRRDRASVIVCSEPLAGMDAWAPVPSGSLEIVT